MKNNAYHSDIPSYVFPLIKTIGTRVKAGIKVLNLFFINNLKAWIPAFAWMTILMLTNSLMAMDNFLEQADQLYYQRTETTGAKEALDLYEKIISSEPTSVPALWKAARACYWIADHSTKKREKIDYFQKGIAHAEKATATDPKCVEAHFWLGGLYGSYGEVKGILKSLALLKPIRKEMDTINRLNDRFHGGAGYRVLGIVDYKVPGFAGGSKKRAQEQINKAIMIDPTNPFNQYYAAELYGTVLGDKKRAIEHLDTLLTLGVNDDVDAPDLKMIQAKGARLKAQIGT